MIIPSEGGAQPSDKDLAASPATPKRAWTTPRCEELPPLTDLTMQQGSGIHGGGGGGGTVFPL